MESGSIIVVINIANKIFLPGNLNLAKPYATIAQAATVNNVVTSVSVKLFMKKVYGLFCVFYGLFFRFQLKCT